MPRTRTLRVAATLLALGLGACSRSATEPETVSATIQQVTLTPEANAAWPFTPTVFGGANVTVRGVALFGCGTPAVTAARHDREIVVIVSAADADRPCVANLASWRPYEAHVTGLDAGRYAVRARAVGHVGEAAFSVNVSIVD